MTDVLIISMFGACGALAWVVWKHIKYWEWLDRDREM